MVYDKTSLTLNDIISSDIAQFYNDPENQDLISELNKDYMTEEEKLTFQDEFLNDTDFFDFSDFDEDYEKIYEECMLVKGKLTHVREINTNLRSEIKDYKNTISALKEELKEIKLEEEKKLSLNDLLTPPSNIDTEIEILRSFFHNPSLMNNFNQKYLNLMFHKGAHRKIHSAMMDVKGMTLNSLSSKLKKREYLEYIGGDYYLSSIFSEKGTNEETILNEYIKEAEQHFLAREVINLCSSVQTEAFTGEKTVTGKWKSIFGDYKNKIKRKFDDKEKIDDYVEYIRDLSFRVLDLIPFRFRKQYNLAENVDAVVYETKKLIERNGKPLISTGYKDFDKFTHGLRPNKLFMVGARPKIGKTSFCVNIADNVLKQDKYVAFFSYELSYKEVLQKFIAKRANIDLEKFEYFDDENTFTKEEQERLYTTAEEVKNLPLRIRTGKLSSLDYFVNECYQAKLMHPDLSLVVVDSLQSFEYLVPPKSNKSDFFYHVLTVLKKDVAEELNLTVMLTAQLKAKVEQYKNKKPRTIDDFSDCKGIPEVADGAFLLYRPEHYFEDSPEFKGWINIHPLDLRNSGRRNKQFKLGVDMKYCQMFNYKE